MILNDLKSTFVRIHYTMLVKKLKIKNTPTIVKSDEIINHILNELTVPFQFHLNNFSHVISQKNYLVDVFHSNECKYVF